MRRASSGVLALCSRVHGSAADRGAASDACAPPARPAAERRGVDRRRGRGACRARRAQRRRAPAERAPRPTVARPRIASRAERGACVAVLDSEGGASDPGAREGVARSRARETDDVRGASLALMEKWPRPRARLSAWRAANAAPAGVLSRSDSVLSELPASFAGLVFTGQAG